MFKNARRPLRLGRALVASSLLAIFAASAYSQTAGKIAGVVTEAGKKTGMVGVNVSLEGTSLGASTDSEGRYFILNVPPGTYTIRATFIGYKVERKSNLKVSVGQTTNASFVLTETVIAGEEVTIVATKPLVEKDLTMSQSKFSAGELQNKLPVAKTTEILETSPSFYRGFIRGGAKQETKTLIDGVDVSDSYFSGGQGSYGRDPGHSYQNNRPTDEGDNSGLTIASGALQEINVFAGTFTAEYPSATAGIVNAVTRDGKRDFSFSFFNRTQATSGLSHKGSNIYHDATLYTDERDLFAGSETPELQNRAGLYTWNKQKAIDAYNYDPNTGESLSRSSETSFTLSGPITSKGSFFMTGSHKNIASPLPFEETKNIGGSFKASYNFTATRKLSGMFQFNDGGEWFNFSNGKFNPRYKYFMEGAPRYKDLNTMGYLKYTQTLSQNTFFEIQASQTKILSSHGYSDDNGNGRVELGEQGEFIDFDNINEYIKYVGGTDLTQGNGFVPGDPSQRVFFSPTLNPGDGWQDKVNAISYTIDDVFTVDGGYLTAYPMALYNRYDRSKLTLKGDLTSQVNYNNQVKAGFMFTRHNVNINSLQSELGGAGKIYPTSKFHVNYLEFKPTEIAAYVQDKLEYEGLVLNLGVRLDAFNPDTKKFSSDFNPTKDQRDADNELEQILVSRGEDVGYKYYVSPRIGVSHPVTSNFAMTYSFGRFFQYPNYSTLYTDYHLTDFRQPTLFGVRADQEPIRSTNYDISARYAISNNYLFSATAYYRDVQNTGRRTFGVTTAEGHSLNLSTTWGYSDARGVELELSKRPSKWWGGRISYAYSYIKNAGSAGSTVKTNYAAGDSATYGNELPWEELNRAPSRERNILVNQDGSNILSGGFDRPHRFNGVLQFFLPAEITTSLTGEWTSGFYYQLLDNASDPFFDRGDNLEVGPSTFFVNMRLSKTMRFSKYRMELFVEGRNLFDRTNIRAVSPDEVGSNNRSIWEDGRINANGAQVTAPATDPEGDYKMPTDRYGRLLYLNAREFYMGLSFNFN